MMVWYGRFRGPTRFGCPGVALNVDAAVLQRDPGARHHYARPEAVVVGLDHRHHHPVGVGRGQIHRAALRRPACRNRCGPRRVYHRRPPPEVVGVQQLFRPHRHVIDVGDVGQRVGECELDRLDLQVHAVCRIHWERGHVEVLQNAKRDQRDDPLTVRWDLVQRVAAVVDADRIDPVRAVRGQVGGHHRATVRCRMCLHRRRQLAPIERLPAGRRDRLQCRRVLGKPEPLPRRRRPPTGKKRFGESGL